MSVTPIHCSLTASPEAHPTQQNPPGTGVDARIIIADSSKEGSSNYSPALTPPRMQEPVRLLGRAVALRSPQNRQIEEEPIPFLDLNDGEPAQILEAPRQVLAALIGPVPQPLIIDLLQQANTRARWGSMATLRLRQFCFARRN